MVSPDRRKDFENRAPDQATLPSPGSSPITVRFRATAPAASSDTSRATRALSSFPKRPYSVHSSFTRLHSIMHRSQYCPGNRLIAFLAVAATGEHDGGHASILERPQHKE